MHERTRIAVIGLAVVIGLGIAASGDAESLDRRITYQGRIPELPDADVVIRFRLHDAPAEPSALLWGPEEQRVQLDTDGSFVAVLGETGLDLDDDLVPDLDEVDPGQAWYLEIEVESEATTVLLAPRRRLFPAFHAVSASTLVDGAVTSAMLASNAVEQRKIADATLESVDFASESLTADRFAVGAITADRLAASSIGSSQLAVGSVNASKIVDGSVGGSELATGAVTREKLANASVTNAALQTGRTFPLPVRLASVTSEKLGLTTVLLASPGVRQFCAIADIQKNDFGNTGETVCQVDYNATTRTWTGTASNTVQCLFVCF